MTTSRHEDGISNLHFFEAYHVNPMTKRQTIALLSRLAFDDDVKQIFIQKVEADLFNKHRDFLSVPLLATMMLLTFSKFSNTTSKMHIFYRQAFELLFQRHDRSKGGAFTRSFHTDVSIVDFHNIFSFFCVASYVRRELSFSDVSLIEGISKAVAYEKSKTPTCDRLDLKSERFLRDLTESTCLLQRDGLEYTFVHRSFQEYFAADFISQLDSKQIKLYIDAIVCRQVCDNVLMMIADIKPNAFERGWALPTVKELRSRLAQIGDRENAAKCLSAMFSQIHVGENVLIVLDETKQPGMQLHILNVIYDNRSGENRQYLLKDGAKGFKEEMSANPKLRHQLGSRDEVSPSAAS